MNVKEFLSGVYKDAQIFAEENDEITNQDYSRGLRHLNYVLTGINLNKFLISYRTSETLSFIPGQELYNVNLVEIEVVYFLLSGSVKLVLTKLDLARFTRNSQVVSAFGPPTIFYIEPKPDFTTDITVYLKPSQAETVVVWGRRRLQHFSSINDVFPVDLLPYHPYIGYKTGVALRSMMGLPPNPALNALVLKAAQDLEATSPLDTTVQPSPYGRSIGGNIFDVGYTQGAFGNGR